MTCFQLDPAKGNIAFGCGLHGWGFNLRQFAAMYAEKFKVKEEKFMQKLWGSNFYNSETRKWSTVPGEGYERGFNKFVMEPLMKVGNNEILTLCLLGNFACFFVVC